MLTYSVTRHFDHEHGTPHAVFVTFFAGTILAALGLPLAAPVAIRLLADAMVRLTARPSLVLAARRMQQEPAGTNRLVMSLLVALFIIIGARCVLVVGDDAAGDPGRTCRDQQARRRHRSRSAAASTPTWPRSAPSPGSPQRSVTR